MRVRSPRLRRPLFRSWAGTLFLHAVLWPPWAIYLATLPREDWSVGEIPIVLFLVMSGYVLVFWTLYLSCVRSPAVERFLLGGGAALYRVGQACAALLLLFLLAKLIVDHAAAGTGFLGEPYEPALWVFHAVVLALGLQHYAYRFTSGTARGRDGLAEMLERGAPIDWSAPRGGSIGVELRRLRARRRAPRG